MIPRMLLDDDDDDDFEGRMKIDENILKLSPFSGMSIHYWKLIFTLSLPLISLSTSYLNVKGNIDLRK